MKRVSSILFSTRLTAIFFLVYAFSMAYATFMENDYGTPTAKALIYNARWFEVVQLLLIINFIGNIKKYQLWRREKLSMLAFHIAFIIIFIGAAISRYYGFEGMMPIREGATSNEIISDKTYFKLQISDDKGLALAYDPVDYIMSPLHKSFKQQYLFQDQKIKLETLNYIERAKDSIIQNPQGKAILHIVTTASEGRVDNYIVDGEIKNFNGMLFSFNKEEKKAIQITYKADKLLLKSPFQGNYMVMATKTQGIVPIDSLSELHLRSLYSVNNVKFVLPDIVKYGKLIQIAGNKTKDQAKMDVVTMKITTPKASDTITFTGGKGITDYGTFAKVGGLDFTIGYGSNIIKTPFAVRLKDFQLDRYPGSNSPSSFASEISLIDDGKSQNHRIYMNNVLDHKGYRLFQSGYDPDEMGTKLSVNYDFWGTLVTYIGYTLLFISLTLTLFWKGTRFWKLNQQLKDLATKKIYTIGFLLFISFGMMAQHQSLKPVNADSLAKTMKINLDHSERFGKLLVQDQGGRIKPINTMALEILRKVYKKDNYYTLNANQWFIAIHLAPSAWGNTPLIKIGEKGGEPLAKKTKANAEGYTTLINLFNINHQTGEPEYILKEEYETAFRKKPSERSKYENEVMNVDERVQIIQALVSGSYLRIIPIQNDLKHTWTSWLTKDFKIDPMGLKYFKLYFSSVALAQKTNNWATADKAVKAIDTYQQTWGKSVVPSRDAVDWEIRYNQWNIFFKVMIVYTIIGLILLILAFTTLFTDYKWIKPITNIFVGLLGLGFVVHASGLALRWFISGHAPWSNGYESIVFIAWGTIFAGLAFYQKRSAFIPAMAALLSVTLLGIAHGSLMTPEITPLVPVLKSYWLMVHVAVITSSYGFLALGAFLGLVVLILFIIRGSDNSEKINHSIKELTIINEITLTVGLFMLTIGTFLGGIWANESWGRYWSWDPKETWAFISVMIYAFVLHMRLVPKLRNEYSFNLACVWAVSSIIMTYFGVNYYLSGLHSYAKGDPVPIPMWVPITASSLFVLSIVSYFRYKFYKK